MKSVGILNVAVIVVVACSAPANAFFGKMGAGGGGGAAAKSPFADEAIAAFAAKHPFGREPLKPSKLLNIGMPGGENTANANYDTYQSGDARGKRLTDISEQDARSAFAELAKCYGPEAALTMTKAKPVCLAFSKQYFAPCLKEYSAIFGEEEAKAMVTRNPGLLAVTPIEAARANDTTMKASYLISATAPYGNVLLPGVLALLTVPGIESVSGIPIRATLFSSLGF